MVPKLVFSHKDVRLSVLRIPEFESQKFLRSIKIPVFSFLKFSYFEPLIFLKFCTKNTFRTIILGQKISHVVLNVDEIGNH